MALLYVAAGVNHFVSTRFYEQIMPPWIPWHRPLVYASGVAEIALGLALLVAVFPANLHMAMNEVLIDGEIAAPAWALWLRLPLQAVLIAWAFCYTRPSRAGA